MGCKHGNGTACFRARDGSASMFAAQHTSSLVVGVAVRLIAGLAERFDAAFSTSLPHDVAGHIAERQVLYLWVPDWTLSKNEAGRGLL